MNNKNMNQNASILESMISAALHTKFNNRMPTEDEFIEQVTLIREISKGYAAVTDEEFDNILAILKANISIQVDEGVAIIGDEIHQSWLPARRAQTDFFFWERYRQYLEQVKRWGRRVITILDRDSDEIVDLLGDPQSQQPFSRRGLVIGDVQSGKTSNYTAIINKAADTGYKVIIVLAGLMENLRKQTQIRLDEEFVGKDSRLFEQANMSSRDEKHIGDARGVVGVGTYGTQKVIAQFTAADSDFSANATLIQNTPLGSLQSPVLLVVKKNKPILNRLYKWLTKNKNSNTGKIMYPLLMIDDEADNASINTNVDEDPTAINKIIRSILSIFNQSSYIGITATPFANIFINPDTKDDMENDDLFPRDFIYSIASPSNYVGADRLFSDNADLKHCLVEINNAEMEKFFPLNHKKSMLIAELPPSMLEALGYFLLFNAIRDARGATRDHRSMMVHVSRFTRVQNSLRDKISEWLANAKADIRNYHKLPSAQRDAIDTFVLLRRVWDRYGLPAIIADWRERNQSTASLLTWDTLCSKYLYNAVAPIDVRVVNQTSGTTGLDYDNHLQDGLRVIAVGGNSLSRGITLEGLGVSYFYRRSQMYDTLLQMARWFGYRTSYEDLFKIWISRDAIDWFSYITEANNELKSEIARMRSENRTPREYGLKVRQDPNSLIVTARNKMRHGSKVTRPITVAGRLLETPRLKHDVVSLKANEDAFKTFINRLATVSAPEVQGNNKNILWRNVPKEPIVELVRDFDTHPWHLSFQGNALADYIDNNVGGTWDVALMSGSGRPYPESFKYGDGKLEAPNTEKRYVTTDGRMILISGTKVRVGSVGSTKIGLPEAKIKEIEETYRQSAKGKAIPDSAYLVESRNPLLMLHIIEVERSNPKYQLPSDIPEFLFAIGIGFPRVGNESVVKTANYVVNVVELRNWGDAEEYADE